MLGEHLSKTKDKNKLWVILIVVILLLLTGVLMLTK